MRKLIILPLAVTALACARVIAAGSEEKVQPPSNYELNLEWGDYGLNFEWAKNKQLVKALKLTEQQESELTKLVGVSTQTLRVDAEIGKKEADLIDRIELVNVFTIKGRSGGFDLAAVEPLIRELSGLRGEQYTTKMLLKAKLKLLLTEDQRIMLRNYFRRKENELKEKEPAEQDSGRKPPKMR
jgi:hypothetical protein